MLEEFRGKRRHGEKIYDASSLFIGVRGVVSRKCLNMTVASFPEDACPLRRSEGDVFYQNSGVFVESDHRNQPASPRG
jgi:hypothetical protein